MPKPPLNYTTKVPVGRTTGECLALLAEAGATTVSLTYEDRKPAGLAFKLDFGGQLREFVMPVDIGGVHKLLQDATYPATVKPAVRTYYATRQHAERVAWRIVKDWLEAQLALIEAGMTTLPKVMLAYLQVESGGFYEAVEQRATLAVLDAS